MHEVLRILDANANRAREALRVMEEAARFALDDAVLTEAIKQLRHDLTGALTQIDGLEAARDTPGDVGARLSTSREADRASIREVVVAASKRLSEALRVMEEYGKTLPGACAADERGFAQRIEALRYQGYDLEQRLDRALGGGRARQWRLCVLISEALCTHHDWRAVARQCIDHGAGCLQLREKNLPAGEMLDRARELVALASAANETNDKPDGGVSVIINDRPDVALLAGADGVHLGQDDLPCREARRLAGSQLLIGVSTSNLDQAKQAMRAGGDYCGVGPMFATSTKHNRALAGPAYLAQYLEWGGLPHLAIGGITPTNVGQLIRVGARGLAVSSAVCGAEAPGEVVRQLSRDLLKT